MYAERVHLRFIHNVYGVAVAKSLRIFAPMCVCVRACSMFVDVCAYRTIRAQFNSISIEFNFNPHFQFDEAERFSNTHRQHALLKFQQIDTNGKRMFNAYRI